jgi:hypothetical protein
MRSEVHRPVQLGEATPVTDRTANRRGAHPAAGARKPDASMTCAAGQALRARIGLSYPIFGITLGRIAALQQAGFDPMSGEERRGLFGGRWGAGQGVCARRLARMVQEGVPPTPENFTVWYNYYSCQSAFLPLIVID